MTDGRKLTDKNRPSLRFPFTQLTPHVKNSRHQHADNLLLFTILKLAEYRFGEIVPLFSPLEGCSC